MAKPTQARQSKDFNPALAPPRVGGSRADRRFKTPDGVGMKFIEAIASDYLGTMCLIWPFGRGNDGYGLVAIGGKKVRVSRIVCEIENGPAPEEKMDAAHSCGNGHFGCIARKHLRWATRIENSADTRAHGTLRLGEAMHSAKLTEKDIVCIREARGRVSVTDLAEKYGVVTTTISSVQYGKTWAHVGGPLVGKTVPLKAQEAKQ